MPQKKRPPLSDVPPLKFYNTMAKKKEVFSPVKPGEVKIYNCGPTVYDLAHIGNFRAYLFADLLRRYLEFLGYRVTQVMNITDVGHMTQDDVADAAGEDKIEMKAKKEHKSPWEIAKFYTEAFLSDAAKLRLKEPHARPRATQHVKEMIALIKNLLENKKAYVVSKNVYYDVTSFKKYGRLSGNTLKQLKAGARLDVHPDKKNPFDFALWIHDTKHIMQWDAPWGSGYPGWHIECSAMSMKYLGETFDIHTGGEDNIFPHHECEIAQSEGATNKTFVNYWLHTRHLLVDNEKMSKSKGNFYTLRDLLEKGHDATAFRYLCMATHYRTPMNFTFDALKGAKKTVDNINDFVRKLHDEMQTAKAPEKEELQILVEDTKKAFIKHMNNDLNMPEAMSVVFDMMNVFNRMIDEKKAGKSSLQKAHKFMREINKILEILDEQEELGEDDMRLIREREEARLKKNFEKADHIRLLLKKRGILLEDTTHGVRWKKIKIK